MLLREVDDEAARDDEYFKQNITYKLLSKSEVIEEDVVANLRVSTEKSYATWQHIYNNCTKQYTFLLIEKLNVQRKPSFGQVHGYQKK